MNKEIIERAREVVGDVNFRSLYSFRGIDLVGLISELLEIIEQQEAESKLTESTYE